MYNDIIRKAPVFGKTGPPMYMIMYRIMNTDGGFSVFTKAGLNEHYKKMMQTWATFLTSPDSRDVLNTSPDGWLNDKTKGELVKQYAKGRKFEQIFICDQDAPYYGYTSYEDFFNRRYREINVDRPLEHRNIPAENLQIVSAPCESTVYAIQENVQAMEEGMLIKGEVYSLHHLLCGDESVNSFVGGTIFQTFLNTTDYHRWHAPVDGTIKRIVSLPGTYFAQAPSTLNDPHPIGTDTVLPPYLRSLRYFANTAARLIFYIQSDNDAVGLMCFIALGMTEISSCEATTYEGQKIKRGDQLGLFHFGGSSSLLVFNKGARFLIHEKYKIDKENHQIPVHINATLGLVAAPKNVN
jgi:phosphatidylserine decarboxylase